MAEQENVITKTYDMLLYILPLLEQYPKKYKYFLAEKIQSNILEIMEDLIEADLNTLFQKEIISNIWKLSFIGLFLEIKKY